VGEESSSIIVKYTTSLVTREKSFIKIPYEHPRDINGLADVSEVAPKVGTLSMIGAGIDASACSGDISTANIDSYGELVGVKDGGSDVTSRMLKEPNSSGVTASFNNMNRGVSHIRPKDREFRKRNMSFKNSHESRLMLTNQLFQMSSCVTTESPSDVPREE
jgi:hypothetical protein